MSEVTEEIVIPEETQKALAEKAADHVMPALEGKVAEAVDKALEDKLETTVEGATKKVLDEYLAKTEEIEKAAVEKANKKATASDMIAKGLEAGDFSQDIADMSPAMRFYMAARALDPEVGDRKLLKQLNKFALATQIEARKKVTTEKGFDAAEKTGYANETTAADGAVLIPDAEFVTTVFDNLPSYGVAFRYADVRQTDRTSVRVLSRSLA
jgi:adenine-specific DNA methylase